jgi:hypothetical protein
LSSPGTWSLALVLALAPALSEGQASRAGEQIEVSISGTRAIVDAARVLYDGVNGDPRPSERFRGVRQRDWLLRPLDHADRFDWSYWPRERAGLALSDMDASQRAATQDLLASVLSSQGHLKVLHIMQLEDVLRALDTYGIGRDPGNYSLALFGEPSVSAPFGFRFEGHHVSINVTVQGSAVRVTPSFFGSNPDTVRSGILSGFRPLRFEEDYARRLVKSLDTEQRARAIGEQSPPSDVVSGQLGKERDSWNDWREALTAEGLPLTGLSQEQRAWLDLLLDEIFGNYQPRIVAALRSAISGQTLVFRWLGSTEAGEPHYYSLLGDTFVFEYDNVQGNATHIHTVWRDRDADFGIDLLDQHYAAEH